MSESASTKWISQAEAAEYLGVTDRTIRLYIAQGQLPAYRINRRLIRISQADLDNMLRPIPAAGGRHGA